MRLPFKYSNIKNLLNIENISVVCNRLIGRINKPLVTMCSQNYLSKEFVGQLNTNVKFETLPTPIKSENDKKEYRVIRLENGLTVCLISKHDENTETAKDVSDKNMDKEMAAAALCVGVGAFSDPCSVRGMAHFLEHMLFMGSEKYPQENDFGAFISNMGGFYNAHTCREVTTFYFGCLESKFYPALDKFAQFFIAPLMRKESMDREREAIDSEFQMSLPNDGARIVQLLNGLAREECPVKSLFIWGNRETLKNNVSDDELYNGVHEFRKRHYSAHRMTLAVKSNCPLEALQSYVLDCFGNIPSNNLPPDDFSQFTDVFDTSDFSKIYYIQPLKEITQLQLRWALPSLLHKYKSKPHHYLGNLIGDEGKGSLLSYLMKKKNWVLSLTAGIANDDDSHFNHMYSIFCISMSLTEDAVGHLDEIVDIVFSYINMVKKIGPQEWYFKELKKLNHTSFKFWNESNPVDVVQRLSEDMQLYLPEDYITGPRLLDEYNSEDITMVLNKLVPEKMNITVMCNQLPDGFTFDRTEKWFGIKYAVRDIPVEWVRKWQNAEPLDDLSLPPPNIFISEDFAILEDEENHPKYPERVIGTEMMEFWYRKDEVFKLPKAYYCFYLISPLLKKSALTEVLMLYLKTFAQIQLTEDIYPATVANLGFSASINKHGLVLNFGGYHDKLPLLIELITEHLKKLPSSLPEDMFQAVQEKIIKFYRNRLLEPSALSRDVMMNIKFNNYNTIVDKYNISSSVRFEDVKNFAKDFLSNLYIKVLVQGNVSKGVATSVVNNFVTTLNCSPIDSNIYLNDRVCQLPKGSSICKVESLNVNDSNSIITNYYQSEPYSIRSKMIVELIMLLIQDSVFDTLRTKEQLGYSVYAYSNDDEGILGLSINVTTQASKNSTEYVDGRIDEFVAQTSEFLASISAESFEKTRKDFIAGKELKDVVLWQETLRNWHEIIESEYIFDRRQQEIATVREITIEDIRNFWKQHTSCRDNCRKLSLQVVGFKTSEEDLTRNKNAGIGNKNQEIKQSPVTFLEIDVETRKKYSHVIKNIPDYKRNLYLYPVVKKHFRELKIE